jgi:hypothetical protein
MKGSKSLVVEDEIITAESIRVSLSLLAGGFVFATNRFGSGS